jgi:emfourin
LIVRIDFSVDGGLAAFPGLATPVTIDCDALAPQERAHLCELVDRAGLFARTGQPSPGANVADARRYTIAVDDGSRRSTVTVTEPVRNDALRALISHLRSHARAARRKP